MPEGPQNSELSIESLLRLRDNHDQFRRLKEQLGSPLGVVPFVGAGLSIPCGMPGWTQFLLAESASIGIESQIRLRLEQGQYEEAAESLLLAMGHRAFWDRIDSRFGPHRLAQGSLAGPVLELPYISRGPVVTTNYDRVLERVYEECGRGFVERVWGARPDMFARSLHSNARYLLKVHGDVEDRADRVLTLSDYVRHYGAEVISEIDMERPLPKLIAQLFTSRTLLFLGCSLTTDRTVQLLKKVAESHGSPPPHYAIVELAQEADDVSRRIRELSALNIRPLWFPKGQYEAITMFVKALAELPASGEEKKRAR